jgi:Na+-driven multidrug efflux pump
MRQITLAAVVYCVGIVTPLMIFGGPRLARALAESSLTAELGSVALAFCPLACLAMIPFTLCRPAFEGLQRGRPGLLMAVLRYAILTVPCAFAGMQAAHSLGKPALYGLLAGLIVASGIASIVFFTWMRRFLSRLERQVQPAGREPAALSGASSLGARS